MKKLQVKLTTPALFLFLTMLKKVGFNFKDFFTKAQKIDEEDGELGEKQSNLGMNMFFTVLNNLDKAEDEAYEFLSKILNITIEEVKEMDIFADILPVLKSYDGWSVFLDNAFKLNKTLQK